MKFFSRFICLMVLVFCIGGVYAQSSIEGTWKYMSTTLEAESAANIRKQLNSDTKLEQKLGQSLTKVGFRAGSTLKFDNEGNFVQRINGKNFEGTYTCASDLKSITMRFNGGAEDINITLDYQVSQVLFTIPSEHFMEFVNVNETKANSETLYFIRSLVTQFAGTKLVMRYVR